MTNCACDVIYIPGSGDGQQIFLNSLQDNFSQPVTYIGSDSVLSDADYNENPDLQMIPMLAGYAWSGGHPIKYLSHHFFIYSLQIRGFGVQLTRCINPKLSQPQYGSHRWYLQRNLPVLE